MKIDAFLTCLGYYGISTGAASSLEGAYSLSSGTTGVFFNQLYSSGAHYVNGQIYGPTIPLINVYGNNIINNNMMTGRNGLRIGYTHSGNFSLVMDIEYSGCLRPRQQKGMVLVTTASTPSGLSSGFMVGITESNRLFFQTSGYQSTLDRELGTRDFVYVSLASQQYVSVGILSLDDNVLYKKSVSIPSGRLASNDLYIGNFLTCSARDPYTGFSGKFNQAVLFSDTLTDTDVTICSNCCLATGFNTGTSSYSFIAQAITGSYFSGVMDWAVTGTTNVIGKVTNSDGSTSSVIYPSGMTGWFQTGQVVVPLFSGLTIQGFRDEVVFLYDTSTLSSFSKFSIFFHQMLSSGDSIEVYTYPQTNPNIGKKFDGIEWPNDTGAIQLISNGLNETRDVDYIVYRNQISGFNEDDVLSYDEVVTTPIITAYSGYWSDDSKLSISGIGLYPSSPQYFENANFTGIVKITGLSGVCTSNRFFPRFGWDLHMNGQKLISGLHYDVVGSGGSGFVVSLSGKKLPPLIVYGIYDPTGGGPIAVASVDDNELAFIPQFSGFKRARVDVTGDNFNFGTFTGFGEQVWVNGIRMLRDLDYNKTIPCSMITGTFVPPTLDFILYDSTAGNDTLWNIATPPLVIMITGANSAGYRGQGLLINPYDYQTSGNVIECWSSELTGPSTFGPFKYAGIFATGSISLGYNGYQPNNSIVTGVYAARYHCENVIGQWSITPQVSFEYLV